jgi:hypothetical protein
MPPGIRVAGGHGVEVEPPPRLPPPGTVLLDEAAYHDLRAAHLIEGGYVGVEENPWA